MHISMRVVFCQKHEFGYDVDMFIFALGEFGIVYKAHFVKSLQLHVMPDIVAVKTLKGQQ